MYEDFMDRIQNFNLQQMVTTPTRQENILDLFLTNTPSRVQNTETLPTLGTSDHDIVFHELHIKIGRPFQPKIPIRMYRRSNWEYFKTDLSEFGTTVIFTGDSQPCSNKKFYYSFVKHNKTEQCGVAPLKQQGLTYSDPVDKANVLNRQFESVFSKPQPLSLKQLAEQATASIYTPNMQIIDISIEGVDKLLQGLSPNKASGPDEISLKILKELHHEIAPILTLIFNLSLETGVVPIDWRTADVVPVNKKGSKSKASNYRPISLTCIASKLLEHILVSNSMSHFDDNNHLSQCQHGFRSEHSCESQLISFTQEVYDNLENGNQTDIIVMDFSKAFDKVDHNKLIYTLSALGIHPLTTRWIK